MRTRADRILKAARAEAEAAGVPVNGVAVTQDAPHNAIIEIGLSRKADVISLGSHGRHGQTGPAPGSITQKARSNSEIPLPVYR